MKEAFREAPFITVAIIVATVILLGVFIVAIDEYNGRKEGRIESLNVELDNGEKVKAIMCLKPTRTNPKGLQY